MNKILHSILLCALIVGLNAAGLLAVGETLAAFYDTEESTGNGFSAGSLDFSLTETDFDFSIGLTEEIDFSSILTTSGTIPFVYEVGAEKISGSDTFCDALDLEAELNGSEKHGDSLLALDVPAATTLGTWTFAITLPVGATGITHGEKCEVDFVFRAWQSELSYPEGFNDEERINITFTSRMIVLNEFLPNPEDVEYGFDFGKDSSDMPQGEWVELYNNSDSSFDLAGWYIWDASGSETNKIFITGGNTSSTTTIIPAGGWLVVYMNKAVLNNTTGDTVKLYDGSSTLIDSHMYTLDPDYCDIEPTPGDENSTITTGDCGGVPPNKSYARIPDGIGGWVDPIPTPGGVNKLEEEYSGEPARLEQEQATTTASGTQEEPSISEEVTDMLIVESASSANTEAIEIVESAPVATSTEPVLEVVQEDTSDTSVDEEFAQDVVSEIDDLADENEDENIALPPASIPEDENEESITPTTEDEPPVDDNTQNIADNDTHDAILPATETNEEAPTEPETTE